MNARIVFRRCLSLVTLIACASAPASAATTPAGDYRIHAGDQLAVSVYGEPTLSQTVVVLADQTIQYPMIGRVSLAGQTPSQASDTMRRALSRYVRNPIVAVGVVTQGQLTIMVLGNVKTPGKYSLPFGSRVTDAIAAAGGLGPVNGPYPDARVSDTAGVRDASLQRVLHDGDVADDLALADNAVVYVPSPITFAVEVVGAVDKPGEIQISQGDRLSTAIAKAGNSTNANADLNAIRVTREQSDGQSTTLHINLYKALQDGDRSADIVLQKNDVVYVPQAHKNGSAITGSIFGLLGHFIGF